eukprot:COSAG02_NODE_31502_length_532_cov_1.304850_1_plen_54_part_10
MRVLVALASFLFALAVATAATHINTARTTSNHPAQPIRRTQSVDNQADFDRAPA